MRRGDAVKRSVRKVFLLVSFTSLLTAFAVGSETAAEKNLLKNWTLTEATNPGFPDYWSGYSAWRRGTHKLIKVGYIPGTNTMRLSNLDGKPTGFFTYNYGWSPGREGTVYTFSVYLRSEPPGLIAKIGGKRLQFKEVVVTSQWQKYTVTAPLKTARGYAARFLGVGVLLTTKKKGFLFVNAPVLQRKVERKPTTPRDDEKDLGPIPSARISILKSAPPIIDGVLNDPCWKEATKIGNFVVSKRGSLEPAKNPTEVYLLRDRKVLYVGAKCFDTDMKRLSPQDWFEVFIADKNLLVYYHFFVHPSGKTGADGSPGVFFERRPQWKGKVSFHEDRWEVEIAIPFFNLNPEYMRGDMWRFNVCRQKYSAPRENTQWSNTGGYFHVPRRFGKLFGMSGIDFTPPVSVPRETSVEATKKYPAPSYMLLDRSYYTTEKRATLKVYLADSVRNKFGRKKLLFQVRVVDESGKVVLEDERYWSSSRDTLLYSFEIENLPIGKYSVNARLCLEGREILTFNETLKKYPPHHNEVKINKFTRMLLVNGKPFIPLISFCQFWGRKLAGHDTPPNALEMVAKDSGFNTLCLWPAVSEENVKACLKVGLKVILFPKVCWEKKGEELTKALVQVFKKYKDYPNLLAWILADEGNIQGSEQEFVRRYKTLKEIDPYHPIFRNEAGWTVGYGGPGGLDSTDIFCGGYGDYKRIDLINVDAIPRGTPSMCLANWMNPPNRPRYATPQEMVCWIYQVLIHGACGGFWWGQQSAKYPIPGHWEALKQVSREIEYLTPIFNTLDPNIKVTGNNEAVHFVVKKYQGYCYLICVNVGRKREKVEFTLDRSVFPSRGEALILFKDGKKKWANWKIVDYFNPFERRVYRIPMKSNIVRTQNDGGKQQRKVSVLSFETTLGVVATPKQPKIIVKRNGDILILNKKGYIALSGGWHFGGWDCRSNTIVASKWEFEDGNLIYRFEGIWAKGWFDRIPLEYKAKAILSENSTVLEFEWEFRAPKPGRIGIFLPIWSLPFTQYDGWAVTIYDANGKKRKIKLMSGDKSYRTLAHFKKTEFFLKTGEKIIVEVKGMRARWQRADRSNFRMMLDLTKEWAEGEKAKCGFKISVKLNDKQESAE